MKHGAGDSITSMGPVSVSVERKILLKLSIHLRHYLIIVFYLFFPSFVVAETSPRVVVSIAPIQALVAGVMAGAGEPRLLVPGGTSPHVYALRPSDAFALRAAQVVVLIDPTFETFLSKPLATLAAGQARVVHVAEIPGMRKYPARDSWLLNEQATEPAIEDSRNESYAHLVQHVHGRKGPFDPHLWLDPENARHIVTAVAGVLAEVDPVHTATYHRNARMIDRDLVALDEALRRELAPVTRQPFIVFHDAYQYLEVHYGLNAVGAATVTPERAPGIRRLSALRERIRTLGVVCVFHEPQFPPKILETIVAGTNVRVGMLDPLGSPGQYAEYVKMMKANARALRACLAPELAQETAQETAPKKNGSTIDQETRQHVQSR